jgi:hypothetical protein
MREDNTRPDNVIACPTAAFMRRGLRLARVHYLIAEPRQRH